MSTGTSRDERDRALLERAVELSRVHMLGGDGGPFGAVIAASDGDDLLVAGEGWNRVTSTSDPTAHAEVTAIRAACAALGRFELSGYTIYSSCEPCPMCLASIYWARLDRLVYANDRHEAAAAGFDDAAFYAEIARPLEEQSLATERIVLASAREVFELWRAKADKVEY